MGCNAGFTKILNDSTTGSFTDTGVANGTTYYYQAVAHPAGNEACASAPSACLSFTVAPPLNAGHILCLGNTRRSLHITCQVINPTGGIQPYSYTWTYTGTATSWGYSGATAHADYSPVGCGINPSYNIFNVTMTDAIGPRSTSTTGNLSCP